MAGQIHIPFLVRQVMAGEFPALYRGQGQKGGPAGVLLFQKPNGAFGGVFVFHHNVLHTAAQRSFNGQGVFFRHLKQPCHRAVDALQPPVFGLLHHRFYGIGKAFQIVFQIPEQLGLLPQLSCLCQQFFCLSLFLFQLFLPPFQLITVPCLLIFQGLHPLGQQLGQFLGLLQLPLGALGVVLHLGQHNLVILIAVGVLFGLAGKLDHRELVLIFQQQQFIDPLTQLGGLLVGPLVLFGQFRQLPSGSFQFGVGLFQSRFQTFPLSLPFLKQPSGLLLVSLKVFQLLGQPGGFLVEVFQVVFPHRLLT